MLQACPSKRLAPNNSRLGRKIVQGLCIWLPLAEALCPHLLVTFQPGCAAWALLMSPAPEPECHRWDTETKWALVLWPLPGVLHTPGTAGPQASILCPPARAESSLPGI